MVQCTKKGKIFSEGCAVRVPRPDIFGDCHLSEPSPSLGQDYENTMNMMFKQAKSDTAKCFRIKSEQTKLWNDPTADYNYYPVCYESNCVSDPSSPLGWKINVSIGEKTVTCTE